MTGDAPPRFAAENLTKRYRTGGQTVDALADVTFTVDPGEFVTVVGPSGCGKTTLIRLLGGLESATSGRIAIDGQTVTGPGPDRAIVFQAYHLFPWLTVSENVAFGLVENGVPEPRRTERTRDMLDLVGLTEFADAYPKELSGGMKQRVGLARALAVDPAVLLLDEPFGSVDAQTRHRLQDALLDIWNETDKTVFFVTHDIEEAVLLGDRVLVMRTDPGRVHETVELDLPRPRERTDASVREYQARLLERVDRGTESSSD